MKLPVYVLLCFITISVWNGGWNGSLCPPVHVFPLQLFKQAQLAKPSTTLHVPPFSQGLLVHGEPESKIIWPWIDCKCQTQWTSTNYYTKHDNLISCKQIQLYIVSCRSGETDFAMQVTTCFCNHVITWWWRQKCLYIHKQAMYLNVQRQK
jgi:hypothetical protein